MALECTKGLMHRSKRACSFDHLISSREQGGWHGDTQSLSSLEVNHQIELDRLLDGEIGGLCALEDLVDDRRAAPLQFCEVGAVAHEPALLNESTVPVDSRQSVLQCGLGKRLAVQDRQAVYGHEEGAD